MHGNAIGLLLKNTLVTAQLHCTPRSSLNEIIVEQEQFNCENVLVENEDEDIQAEQELNCYRIPENSDLWREFIF